MKAITLWRPWSFAMTDCGKRIENRSRHPSAFGLKVGDVFALHAGRTYSADDRAALEDILAGSGFAGVKIPDAKRCPMGVVALARLEKVLRSPGTLGLDPERDVPDDQARWFFGPYGWLCEVVPTVPLPINGERGGWSLPESKVLELRPRGHSEATAFARLLAIAGYTVDGTGRVRRAA